MKFKEVFSILLNRFAEAGVEAALSGGLALSTMGIFRFTKDIDFLVDEGGVPAVERIMADLGYTKQPFSSAEILSYLSPFRALGQVDYLVARRRYSREMLARAREVPVLDGAFRVKVLQPEDLIGLKIQALSNDPENREAVDAPDIQRLLKLHGNRLDLDRVREYFRLFEKENLLDAWLRHAD